MGAGVSTGAGAAAAVRSIRSILGVSLALALPAAMAAMGPTAVQAQGLYTVTVPSGQFGSQQFLNQLVKSLAVNVALCEALPDKSFAPDCLAERLAATAEEIPDGTDYQEVREILESASRDLKRLAASNRDRSKRPVRLSTQDGSASSQRPVLAVAPARAEAVAQQAEAIIEEARTELLRSAGTAERQSQYQQIAAALDSTKVLLRS